VNFNQLSKKTKLTGILFFLFMLLGVSYQLFIKPRVQTYSELQLQEVQLKQTFENLQSQASTMEGYRTQVTALERRYAATVKQFSIKNEMPGLLEDLAKAERSSGVILDSFSPGVERQHDFYRELPIKILVSGGYHQLGVFLSKLSEINRIITLQDFVLESTANSLDKTFLTLRMTIATYRYRSV